MQIGVKTGVSIGLVWPGYVRGEHRAEVTRFVPEGVGLRMRGTFSAPDVQPEDITLEKALGEAASRGIEDTASALAAEAVAAVGYGCTSMSYARGVDGERDIRRRMAAATGLPVATTSGAAAAALRRLGATRIAVLSPHVDAMNERLRSYLHESGFEVASLLGLNLRGAIEEVPPDRILELAADVDVAEADAVFVSCTGMMTSTIIAKAEASLGKPVVTANQATMWKLLRLARAHPSIPNLGRLYDEPVASCRRTQAAEGLPPQRRTSEP